MKFPLLGLFLALSANTAFGESPPTARVRGLAYAGTWCPAGSRSAVLDADLGTIRVRTDGSGVRYSPSEPIGATRKNCQLTLDVAYPDGWSFAIVGASLNHYYVDLGVGSGASATASVMNQSAAQSFRGTLTGPVDAQTRDLALTPSGEPLWSPCHLQRMVSVNESVIVAPGRGHAQFGVFDPDAFPDPEAEHAYKIAWKRCPVTPDDATAPIDVGVRSISYAGSSCRVGTRSARVDAAASTLTLVAEDFLAQIGPGVSPALARGNCQIAIDLAYPDGWSYALTGLRFNHYMYSLDSGVTANFTAAPYFQSQPASRKFAVVAYGPRSGYADVAAQDDGAPLLWSPCNLHRALNLNETILLKSANRNAQGLVEGVDAEDSGGSVLNAYKLAWKRCN